MKINFLNFLRAAQRFRMAMILNILGLSIAFAAFIVIMIQLFHDLSFDKFHIDSDKIFRVEFTRETSTSAILSRPLAEHFFESSPHIIAGGITTYREFDSYFHIEKNGELHFYKENSITVTPGFFNVFTFDFVEGSNVENLAPGSIFIPLSLSRKLFDREPAVGKQIFHNLWGGQTIVAVYRDFPLNSIVKNNIYYAMQDFENRYSWNNYDYYAYIRLNEVSNAAMLFENFKRNFDGAAMGRDFDWENAGTGLRLTPLTDIHFITNVQYDKMAKANKQTLLILFAIAIMIVVIAAINFTNFSAALAPMRIKNINVQRILGAQRITVGISLVLETMFISFLSFIVSLFLVFVFAASPVANLVDTDLTLSSHPSIVGGAALFSIITGLIAGIYPAFYMTSFAPALILKGSFGLSPKGKNLRNILIGFQYVASFVLIIGTSFMYMQNMYMQKSDLGYDRDLLITVNTGRTFAARELFIDRLKAYSSIRDVTYGEMLLSSADQYIGWERNYNGERINYQVLPVHYTFLETLGIKIIEGRDFRADDAASQHGAYIFNETAKRKYNLETGTNIDHGGEIIGFMPDVKFASFRTEVEPMAFYVWGTLNWGNQQNNAYIRLEKGANRRYAMTYIRELLVEFDPNFPFEVRYYDEILHKLYEKEKSLNALITLFSMIAIFISIVGVFGLVVFDSESRRKEIAIRKVHGASTIGIILMFNKIYFKILVICFIIAAPFAWYTVYNWLQSFAYKTPMHWWIFLPTFAGIAAITACTVTLQNWRIASDDPVNALKIE